MFSGIIEEIGTIVERKDATVTRIGIRTSRIFDDLSEGDSISVDGVCLTVEEIKKPVFYACLSEETKRLTTLGKAANGTKVNLERSLKYGDRIGGHFLSGHIDFVSKISYKKTEGKTTLIRIRIPASSLRYFVPKCSVGVDGISLTVAEILNNEIVIWLIPYTISNTTIKDKHTGDNVNIEIDMLMKATVENIRNLSVRRYEKINKEAIF